MSTHRLTTIDILKGAAVVCMVYSHFLIYTATEKPYELISLHSFGAVIIGNWVAPAFAILLGINFHLSYQNFIEKGHPLIGRFLYFASRGLVLLSYGLLASAIIWGKKYVLEWDIVPYLGAASILLVFLHWLNSHILLLIALLSFLSGPLFWYKFGGFEFWQGTDLDVDSNRLSLLKSALWVGYFPIIPWIGFSLLGVIIGRSLTTCDQALRNFLPLALLGMAFTVIGAVFSYKSSFFQYPISLWISDLIEYPNANLSFTLFYGGIITLLIVIIRVWQPLKKNDRTLNFLSVQSKYSLTQYILHFIMLIWPMRMLGFIHHRNEDHYISNIESGYLFVFIATFYLILSHWVFIRWERRNKGYGSIEWQVKILANTLQKFLLRSIKTIQNYHYK